MSLKILSAASDLGYANSFVDTFPDYLKTLGLEQMLQRLDIAYEDLGKIEAPHINKHIYSNPHCKFATTVAEYSKTLAETIEKNVNFNTDTLLTLGGDHSIALGTINGILRKRKKTGVLWIDAHPDANTPETTLTGWIYGMCTTALCGVGDSKLLDINDRAVPRANPKNFCIFGAQYIDPGEYINMEKLGISLITQDQILENGIKKSLDKAIEIVTNNTELVHVSLDLDAIDGEYAPGTSEYSYGQFTYREIKYICSRLGKSGLVNSVDIVEGDPSKDIRGKTGQLALELIAALLGKEYSPYQLYLQENNIE